jgi:hypothetical protein
LGGRSETDKTFSSEKKETTWETRWGNSNETDFKEIRCGSVEWIQLAKDRVQWWVLVNTTMNI